MGGEYAFLKYIRYDPSTIVLVPAEFAIDLGAEIRSVAVVLPSYTEVRAALNKLMPRLGLNIYASVAGKDGPEIKRFSTVASSSGRGFELVVIPVLIAALIVMNAMVASVMERERDIGIFTAVGLSPGQIASLFVAEALVYAAMGCVAGYVLAQIAGKVMLATGWFAGVNLNYSSLGSVLASVIVVAIVLASAIYPARKAKQMATPEGSEEWAMEPATGDKMELILPFTVSAEHAAGLSRFYATWFASFADYGSGSIVTAAVAHGASGNVFEAKATCWLAPFDLGVQQQVRLVFQPTDTEGVYAIKLEIERVSGDPEHWQSTNRRFLKAVRRQFLIWRTLSVEQKTSYSQLHNLATNAQ
jgi:hypothetical protein